MRIQPYSEIDTRIFSSQNQEDFGKLLNLLNPFLVQFNVLLSKNVDFDNLSFNVITAVIEVDGTGKVKQPCILNKLRNNSFSGVMVIKVEKINPNDPFLTAYPLLEIKETENTVQIVSVLGVPANKRYRFTFLII